MNVETLECFSYAYMEVWTVFAYVSLTRIDLQLLAAEKTLRVKV